MPHSLRVCLSNTDKEIMKWVHRTFGGSLQEYPPKKGARAWKWTISCKSAGELLQKMLPYFRVKKSQAEVAIEFQGRVSQWKKNGHKKGRKGALPIPETERLYRTTLAQKLRDIRHSLKTS
jgi:hypothetical protein